MREKKLTMNARTAQAAFEDDERVSDLQAEACAEQVAFEDRRAYENWRDDRLDDDPDADASEEAYGDYLETLAEV